MLFTKNMWHNMYNMEIETKAMPCCFWKEAPSNFCRSPTSNLMEGKKAVCLFNLRTYYFICFYRLPIYLVEEVQTLRVMFPSSLRGEVSRGWETAQPSDPHAHRNPSLCNVNKRNMQGPVNRAATALPRALALTNYWKNVGFKQIRQKPSNDC